jgi:predicted dehydrogenase
MTASRRKVGIIGIGFGSQVYVPAFASEGWDVVALCSRHADKARKAADAAGVPDIHTDPLELIGRPDIDAVGIVTPPGAHHDLTLAALAAGKHVMCEKPFALDTAQAAADARRRRAQRQDRDDRPRVPPHAAARVHQGAARRRLHRAVSTLHDRAFPRPLRDAAAAPVGHGWRVRPKAAGFSARSARTTSTGCVSGSATSRAATGKLLTLRPDLADAATGRTVKAETDDAFVFTLEFASGGIATMIASFAATPARGARLAVMGDAGTLIAEQPGPNPMEDGVVVASRNGSPLQPLPTPSRYTPFTDARDHRLMAFRMLVRDFNDGIARSTSPAPNFTDALRCQEVLDAVRESSRSGRRIVIG